MIKANIDLLKTSRLERGWNFADLARESKISAVTIARIERGGATSPATAKCVADVLEKPVVELFSIE